MLKIEHSDVVGWEHAIRGMRNPMNSWEKSDSEFITADGDHMILQAIPVHGTEKMVGVKTLLAQMTKNS